MPLSVAVPPALAVNVSHAGFLGALIVSVMVLATTAHVIYHHRRRRELMRPSLLLLVLLATQVTLGALTVLSGKQHVINSFHVVTGGSVLITSLVLTLRAHRARFGRGGDATAYVRMPGGTLGRGPGSSRAGARA